MNTYKDYDMLLQGRNKQSRKLANNTYAIRYDNRIAIRLHETDVVAYYPDGNVVLGSGGYRTPVTKDRLNRFSPFQITQNKGVWYIHFPDRSITVFTDNIQIKNGKVKTPVSKIRAELRRTERLTKQINAYCDKIRKMKELPVPGPGDCWLCMRTASDEVVGDVSGGDHLLAHLKEKYVHGSLIVNALLASGCSNPALIYQMNLRDMVIGAVRAYFKKQLHIAR